MDDRKGGLTLWLLYIKVLWKVPEQFKKNQFKEIKTYSIKILLFYCQNASFSKCLRYLQLLHSTKITPSLTFYFQSFLLDKFVYEYTQSKSFLRLKCFITYYHIALKLLIMLSFVILLLVSY